MEFPDDVKYTREHEWVRVEGNTAVVGITDYAQEQLGDIVYVEPPEEGEIVAKGDSLGVVESVKSVSDVYAPVSGKISEANDLKDNPEIVNEDPFSEGWIAKIEMSDTSELNDMLSAKEYEAFVNEEKA